MPYARAFYIPARRQPSLLPALVRDSYDAELRARVDEAMERQLAAFLLTQRPAPLAA